MAVLRAAPPIRTYQTDHVANLFDGTAGGQQRETPDYPIPNTRSKRSMVQLTSPELHQEKWGQMAQAHDLALAILSAICPQLNSPTRS